MAELAKSQFAEYTKLKEIDTVFSRLLIPIPDEKELRYIDAVGSGFTGRSYKEILNKLKVTKKSRLQNHQIQ